MMCWLQNGFLAISVLSGNLCIYNLWIGGTRFSSGHFLYPKVSSEQSPLQLSVSSPMSKEEPVVDLPTWRDIMANHGQSWPIMAHHGSSWPIMANHGSLRVVNSQGLFGFLRVPGDSLPLPPPWAKIRAVAAMMKRYLSWSAMQKPGTADVGGECFWWIISLTWGVVY